MAIKLKEISQKTEVLAPGHRLCAGCGAPIVVRQILQAAEHPVVIANATGCLEVTSALYPTTSWRASWIHSAFENAAATISGVEAAYKALRRAGVVDEEIRFVAFGGDGGTYDIGLQALSGALERGHRFVYVCYDNGAYMNTGIQRSSATPFGASTTTSPVGSAQPGKKQQRKNLTDIVAAHRIPYVAQASPSNWRDLMTKAQKAFNADGPAFLNVISPCVPGWRYETNKTIEMARLAVETCYWPLFEIENGEFKLNYQPKEKLPVTDWIKRQGRFRHLMSPQNQGQLEEFQEQVDKEWTRVQKRAEYQI
jgi:pyruvate ferredoxin oxidoreductase beta subunit